MAPIDFRQPPGLFDLGNHGPEPGLGFHKGPATTCCGDPSCHLKKHSVPVDIRRFMKSILRSHYGASHTRR